MYDDLINLFVAPALFYKFRVFVNGRNYIPSEIMHFVALYSSVTYRSPSAKGYHNIMQKRKMLKNQFNLKSRGLLHPVHWVVRPFRSTLFLSMYLIMTYRTYGNEIAIRVVSTLCMVFFVM